VSDIKASYVVKTYIVFDRTKNDVFFCSLHVYNSTKLDILGPCYHESDTIDKHGTTTYFNIVVDCHKFTQDTRVYCTYYYWLSADCLNIEGTYVGGKYIIVLFLAMGHFGRRLP